MKKSRALPSLAAVTACCSLLAFLASPASADWEWVEGPPRTEEVGWTVSPDQPTNERLLQVNVSSGYCVGEPLPYIHHFEVLRKPRRTVVTAFIRFPAPSEVKGTVEPDDPFPACAGVGLGLTRQVRLGRARDYAPLFDGSFSPPRRVRQPSSALSGQ